MAFKFGIFGQSPAPAPAPAPAAAPTPAPAPGPAGPASQQTSPANPGATPAGISAVPDGGKQGLDQPATLDSFKDLFAVKPVDPNAPKQPTLSDPLLGPIDPAKFQETVKQANFTAGLDPAMAQKALGGDTQALMDLINGAAQNAFTAAATMSHNLSESAARTAALRLDQGLDGRIRSNAIRSYTPENPVLQHPAVAPVLGAIKAQIANQNPQLSAAEVATQAEKYFLGMAAEIQAPAQQEAAKAASQVPATMDFSKF